MRRLFFLLVISLGSVSNAEFAGLMTEDCVCGADRLWQAACPTAVGVFAGGRREPGINVRRCRALNEQAGGVDVCTPGQKRNIYSSPAPAMTNLCRRPQ